MFFNLTKSLLGNDSFVNACDKCSHLTQTGQLICSANQLTGFCTIRILALATLIFMQSSTRLLVVSFYNPENIVNLCGFLLFSECIERNQCKKKQPMEVFYRPQTSDPQLC